jgi:hypothetical protein
MALGIALLSARYDWRYFDPHAFFVPESLWNLTLWDFLGERVNPLNYGLGTIVATVTEPSVSTSFLALVDVALFLALATVAAPFFFWPAPLARRAALYGLMQAGFVSYVTIYLICVLLWSVFLLNFWAFLLTLVLFQYYRKRWKH